jgi:hypothetical protein
MSAGSYGEEAIVNEDFEQLRIQYTRLTQHQYLALAVIAAADAFLDALFANRYVDLTGLHSAYKVAREELEAAAMEREIG